MSEVPNHDQSLPKPEVIDQTVSADALEHPLELSPNAAEADWQTVDFPDALRLDEIPNESLLPQSETRSPEAIALIETLQRENQLLRQQVVQLENNLTQLQVQMQIEALRQEETAPPAPSSTEELLIAQEQVGRLFQELELSHQTSQRQQVLVEALQAELERSQNQVALLEQECAIAQQNWNEQMQQRLQAENNCRDLQMRLHRQQQQTLQFKAALEQALEISTHQSAPAIPEINLGSSTPIDGQELAQTVTPQPIKVSNPPVKPWSVPSNRSTTRFNDSLLKPLAKLLEQEAEPSENDAATARALPAQTEAAPLEQLFPESQQTAAYQTDLGQNEIFDVQPFVSAPESDTATVSEGEASTPIAKPAEANLWSDLAKLLEPASIPPATNPAPNESLNLQELDAASLASEAQTEAKPSLTEAIAPDSSPGMQFNLSNQRNLRVPNLALSQLTQTDEKLDSMPDSAQGFPAPTIQPQRTAKKRQSLAAVDLPTFPRNHP